MTAERLVARHLPGHHYVVATVAIDVATDEICRCAAGIPRRVDVDTDRLGKCPVGGLPIEACGHRPPALSVAGAPADRSL